MPVFDAYRDNYRLPDCYVYPDRFTYRYHETIEQFTILSLLNRLDKPGETIMQTAKPRQTELPDMPERLRLYTPIEHGPYQFTIYSSLDRYNPNPAGFNSLSEAERAIRLGIEQFVTEAETRFMTDLDNYTSNPDMYARPAYYGERVPTYTILNYVNSGNYLQSETRSHCQWSYDTRETLSVDGSVTRVLNRVLNNPESPAELVTLCQSLLDAMTTRYAAQYRAVGNYLCTEYETGQLSYLPASKLFNPNVPAQNQKSRVSGKPVRVLKTLFPTIEASDRAYELLNTALVASMQTSGTFALLTGNELLDAYCRDSWSDSVTWHSCMSYDYCRDYLALYAENPESVSLLVLLDETGATMSRSLIWQTEDGPYQDRIYASDDRETERMKRYARETLNCQSIAGDVPNLNPPSTSQWPYCDTYYYANVNSDGTLTMSTDHTRVYHELTNTDGRAGGTATSRQYAVTYTRTITETVTVYVDASDEYDAEETAQYEIDDSDAYQTDVSDWEHDYTELT